MSIEIDQLLHERQTGLGGSDIAGLFNRSYGCKLRLWRRKRGQEPDFARRESGPMELGRLLEPYFADHYARITGRRVERRSVARHPDYPELLVHVDRMIWDSEKGWGILEIKSVGIDMYNKIRSKGITEDYILQVQMGMLVTGTKWGAIAIGSRNDGVSRDTDLICEDMDRDDVICAAILDDGPAFWATVENGPAPERLDPDDKRCARCEYRNSCQGSVLMELELQKGNAIPRDDTMLPILLEYDERKELHDEAEGLLEETKDAMRQLLGTRTAVRVGDRKVFFGPRTARYWDDESLSKAFAAATGTVDYDMTFRPAGKVAERFKHPRTTRPLVVY